MALDFTGSDTDNVNHGTLGNFNFDPVTVMMWINIQTINDNTELWSKQGNTAQTYRRTSLRMKTTNVLRLEWADTTGFSWLTYDTSDSPLSVNTWQFIVGQFDLSAGAGSRANILVGGLNTPTAARSLSTSEHSATYIDPSAKDFIIGNYVGESASPDAAIAWVGIVDSVLTVAQLDIIRVKTQNIALFTQKLNVHLGYHGASTATDLSGNAYNGTVTGATLADHVPLPPPFGFDVGLPYVVVSGGTALPMAMNLYRQMRR